VGGSLLLASRPDDSDTTSGDISEPDVETSEIGTDDKEHAEWLFGVLDLGQERGIQSERECDLCGMSATPHKYRSQRMRLTSRLVEVALEDVLVEDEQSL
jgi:hypothetical protein